MTNQEHQETQTMLLEHLQPDKNSTIISTTLFPMISGNGFQEVKYLDQVDRKINGWIEHVNSGITTELNKWISVKPNNRRRRLSISNWVAVMERGTKTKGLHFHALLRLNYPNRIDHELKNQPITSHEIAIRSLKDRSAVNRFGFHLSSKPFVEVLGSEDIPRTVRYIVKSFQNCHQNGNFFSRLRVGSTRPHSRLKQQCQE